MLIDLILGILRQDRKEYKSTVEKSYAEELVRIELMILNLSVNESPLFTDLFEQLTIIANEYFVSEEIPTLTIALNKFLNKFSELKKIVLSPQASDVLEKMMLLVSASYVSIDHFFENNHFAANKRIMVPKTGEMLYWLKTCFHSQATKEGTGESSEKYQEFNKQFVAARDYVFLAIVKQMLRRRPPRQGYEFALPMMGGLEERLKKFLIAMSSEKYEDGDSDKEKKDEGKEIIAEYFALREELAKLESVKQFTTDQQKFYSEGRFLWGSSTECLQRLKTMLDAVFINRFSLPMSIKLAEFIKTHPDYASYQLADVIASIDGNLNEVKDRIGLCYSSSIRSFNNAFKQIVAYSELLQYIDIRYENLACLSHPGRNEAAIGWDAETQAKQFIKIARSVEDQNAVSRLEVFFNHLQRILRGPDQPLTAQAVIVKTDSQICFSTTPYLNDICALHQKAFNALYEQNRATLLPGLIEVLLLSALFANDDAHRANVCVYRREGRYCAVSTDGDKALWPIAYQYSGDGSAKIVKLRSGMPSSHLTVDWLRVKDGDGFHISTADAETLPLLANYYDSSGNVDLGKVKKNFRPANWPVIEYYKRERDEANLFYQDMCRVHTDHELRTVKFMLMLKFVCMPMAVFQQFAHEDLIGWPSVVTKLQSEEEKKVFSEALLKETLDFLQERQQEVLETLFETPSFVIWLAQMLENEKDFKAIFAERFNPFAKQEGSCASEHQPSKENRLLMANLDAATESLAAIAEKFKQENDLFFKACDESLQIKLSKGIDEKINSPREIESKKDQLPLPDDNQDAEDEKSPAQNADSEIKKELLTFFEAQLAAASMSQLIYIMQRLTRIEEKKSYAEVPFIKYLCTRRPKWSFLESSLTHTSSWMQLVSTAREALLVKLASPDVTIHMRESILPLVSWLPKGSSDRKILSVETVTEEVRKYVPQYMNLGAQLSQSSS